MLIMLKRTAAALAAVFLCVSELSAQPAQSQADRDRFARAFVIEIDGVRRSEHAADLKLPPASLTKMMSGLLVIEHGQADALVTVSARAAAATGSRLGLRAGERMQADDLLSAMLIASSNDACRALAEWVSGSEEAFVAHMNQRATSLGLTRTHFVNACGHDAPSHLSTASDLAKLARAAMAQPEYARRAGLAALTVTTSKGRRFDLSNHNHLIGRFPGAYGVKSGFTAKGGKCLVAMAERDGHHVLLVMLNARDRWWDADAALDYALKRAGELSDK
jgi:serine-type D-Ala-D-Ala carboxypeptidase (penicillin-binding protein 5/6)